MENAMPAVQETIEQVRKIDVDQYKYGFESFIEVDKAPKGLSEDIVRFISAKKRTGMDARMAPRRLSALADAGRADLGARRLSEDRLPGHLLLCRTEELPARSRWTKSTRRS
jgi:ribosomal protein L24E